MTTQASPITVSDRNGEPQALSFEESAKPKTPLGIVASMIQTKNRKFQSAKSRRLTAAIVPCARPRTSAQNS